MVYMYKHARLDWVKSMEAQAYIKNYRPLSKAGSRRFGLPQKGQPTGCMVPNVDAQNICTSNIIWILQVIFESIYMYIYASNNS